MLPECAMLVVGTVLARLAYHAYVRVLFQDKRAVRAVDSFYDSYSEHVHIILFVHGSCARMGHFAAQIAHCRALGYPIVAFDALGCGRSDKPNIPSAYSTQELLTDVDCVLDGCTDERDVILVGHSFGASAVLQVEHPRVRGVLAIGPVGPNFDDSLLSFFRHTPGPLIWLLRPFLESGARMLFAAKGHMTDPALLAQEREANARNPVYMFKAYYSQLSRVPLIQTLTRARNVPVALVCGAADTVTPLSGVQEVHELVQTSKRKTLHVVENAGHVVMMEKPQEVNAIVEEFLNVCS